MIKPIAEKEFIMKLVHPGKIAEIDRNALLKGIKTTALMHRAGEAVAAAVRRSCPLGAKVLILAGAGNNAGDGYAAAMLLAGDYQVEVMSVLSEKPSSPDALLFYNLCREIYLEDKAKADKKIAKRIALEREKGTAFAVLEEPQLRIRLTVLEDIVSGSARILGGACRETVSLGESATVVSVKVKAPQVIIEAVVGAGARLPLGDKLNELCDFLRQSSAYKIAVDVPLGTNPLTGEVEDLAPHFDETMSLSYLKLGLASYPAKEYAGKLTLSDLSLPSVDGTEEIAGNEYILIEEAEACRLLPGRKANSSKGDFGRLSMLVGSREYQGAAILVAEAALRFGAGYVNMIAEEEMLPSVMCSCPETVFTVREPFAGLDSAANDRLVEATRSASAVLVGSGCGRAEELRALTYAFLREKTASPLVLDADAINVLAEDRENALKNIKDAGRVVVLTPHPLEFARLAGTGCDTVQRGRLPLAMRLAEECGAIVVLKGAATVITDGVRVYINSTGSSALAKAGSGDVLAGALSALLASADYSKAGLSREEIKASALELSALAVYAHGRAGDMLEAEYSALGVRPSDLPEAMARVLSQLSGKKASRA